MRTRNEINNTEWFGHMPDGWEMKPLKSLFSIGKGITVTKADLIEHGVPVVNYGQVHSKLNDGFSIHRELIRYVSPDIIPDNTIPISKGGFIFASTSEDLKGCGNCIYLDSNIEVYAGGDTTQLIPLRTFDNKYFAYLFSTDNWRSQIRRNLVDVKVFHVNPRDLKETYVVVPPRDVQRSIVAFLDSRCKPINEAIARHRMIIDKLEDYRKAVISHTVAGDSNGLDNTRWTWKRFKFIAHVDSNLVEPDNYQHWLHISPESISKGNGRLLRTSTVYEDGVTSCNHLFHKGAILYSKVRPRLNKVIIAPDDGLCSADMYPISTSQFPEWLKYYMLSDQFVEQAGLVSDIRIKMPKINQQELGNLKVFVPPRQDQLEIISQLDYKCAAIDEGVDRQEQVIARLEEYRRSLVFHAVTGRIDCMGGA